MSARPWYHGTLLRGVFIIAVFILLAFFSRYYVKWLWFTSLGFSRIYQTIFLTETMVRLFFGIATFLMIYVNIALTRRFRPAEQISWQLGNVTYMRDNPISQYWSSSSRLLRWALLGTALILALALNPLAGEQWRVVLQFFMATPFGNTEPAFGRDISYYTFILPFYRMLHRLIVQVTTSATILVGIIYLVTAPADFTKGRITHFSKPKLHLSTLIAALMGLKAWDYYMAAFELVLSPRGMVFGGGYTAFHANLPSLRILMIVALVTAASVLLNAFSQRIRWVLASLGVWLAASVVLGIGYPVLIQRFQVEPNEFKREEKYINYNIAATRRAFGLDKAATITFDPLPSLKEGSLRNNQDIFNNIRLWDYRPLLDVYSQLQQLRSYYRFNDIDVDRYTVNGVIRQVTISAREIDPSLLSERAQTWVNQRLGYTHGYGLVISPTNEVTSQGLPPLWVRDLPPSSEEGLLVERPEIYFGELTTNYVIAGGAKQEFDYPAGQTNVYTRYEGHGGIPVNNLWHRILFSFYFNDFRLLLTNLEPGSRILFDREITSRVQELAPFITLDNDPYLVLDDGRLFWIIDAYTSSSSYPYSEPLDDNGPNYLRNSVKVVVDAYQGDVAFYLSDPGDPIIQTWSKLFPELFQSMDKMPPGIAKHIRYPVDLFQAQARIFTVYHMTDPRVFFTKEDEWTIPSEIIAGDSQRMESYYVLARLPGGNQLEYALVLPFTLVARDNMVAWLSGRWNGGDSAEGLLDVFQVPKDSLVYGPMQVEARIDQDAEISQLLTLWSQRGSKVIRGNMLILPVANSLLYIEPIYLQAEQSSLPELTRVIVATGENLAMGSNFTDALQKLVSLKPEPGPDSIGLVEVENPQDLAELTRRAAQVYKDAQNRLREGDFSGYGDLLKELGAILDELLVKSGAINEPDNQSEASTGS